MNDFQIYFPLIGAITDEKLWKNDYTVIIRGIRSNWVGHI
jgi:hypothetical protein